MKKNSHKYSSIFIFLILIKISVVGFGQETVSKGVIDIKKYDLKKNVIDLKGTWAFYDKHLYTPSDFKKNTISKPEYIPVPGLWNKVKKDKSSGGKGYGTYRVIILNTEKGKLYGINLNRIQSSYKIWIDNKLLKEEGIVGKNKKTSEAKWRSTDIIFKADGDTTKLTLQVSNFYHKKGGIEHTPTFGTMKNVLENGWNKMVWNILLLGIFLIMATYHFAAFLFRRNDKSNLFFSLTLIFSAIFSLTVGEIMIADIFPFLSWETLIKVNYISNYLRLLFFALFIYHAFPDELKKLYFKILTYFISAVIVFIIVVPAAVYTETLFIFLITTGITLIYIIVGQIKAIFHKRPGAVFSFTGVLILLGTAVSDILKELQLIDTVSVTIFGIFLFIILHSYLITLQNAFSYKSIKRITQNISIRGKIKDALFSANSYDLTIPLKAVSKVINADRSLLFIYTDNDWLATNEYISKTDSTKLTRIKVFSGKENIFFSSFNLKKTISTKEPVYTLVNEAVKAKDMKYLEGSGIHSILSYPIIKDEIVSGLLYFENYEEKKDFKNYTLSILEDIKPQVSVFMDNYSSYNNLKNLNVNLEKEVYNKTKEIESRTEELKLLREKLEKQNLQNFETTQKLQKQSQEINDGINYSEKIQKALLIDKDQFKQLFPQSFIYHNTHRTLISTFYWYHKISDDEIIYASVNSHGSDVSSSLISILTSQLLNNLILYKQTNSPKVILNQIQEYFEKYPENIGAVDIAVFKYNFKQNILLYSGADMSLYYSYEDRLIEYKSVREPLVNISENSDKKSKRFFSNRRININPGTKIFICAGDMRCNDSSSREGNIQKKELINKLNGLDEYNDDRTDEVINKFFGKEEKSEFLITGIKF